MNEKPTMQMYTFMQDAYDFFNDKLFAGKLPPCLLTLQREKNVMGYFSQNRWEQGSGKGKVHEIALNPAFFITHNPLELMQTIVHEMVHLWQHEFGKPSHRSYHNTEWADKMESIGLMPSSTGRPGGKRTGQKMADYPIKGGPFYLQCIVFSQMGYKLPFYDRYAKTESCQVRHNEIVSDALMESVTAAIAEAVPETEQIETVCTPEELAEAEASLMRPFAEQFDIDAAELEAAREKEALAKRKSVYVCQSCGDRAWGKPTLDLWCGKCKIAFARLDDASSTLLMQQENSEESADN